MIPAGRLSLVAPARTSAEDGPRPLDDLRIVAARQALELALERAEATASELTPYLRSALYALRFAR